MGKQNEQGSLETKRLSLLRILQILQNETDQDHPLTQVRIEEKLKSEYGLVVERKAVGRNLQLLREAGFEIESVPKKGCYLLRRTFEDSELRWLIDNVLSSRHIPARYSKDLIDKLLTLSSKYFKSRANVKSAYAIPSLGKSENLNIFRNVDIADEAIEKKQKIKFTYNRYGKDKKLHKTTEHIVSPYQMIIHNQRYFLIALNEKWKNIGHYRLDRITNIEIVDEKGTELSTIKGYENGIDYSAYANSLPYMFSDGLETVTFAIKDESMIDQVVDWFGVDFRLEKSNERLLVTVKVSPSAMEYWALQYLKNIEVISPQYLRDKIIEDLKEATEKYTGE